MVATADIKIAIKTVHAESHTVEFKYEISVLSLTIDENGILIGTPTARLLSDGTLVYNPTPRITEDGVLTN